jgi:hypothetical protein
MLGVITIDGALRRTYRVWVMQRRAPWHKIVPARDTGGREGMAEQMVEEPATRFARALYELATGTESLQERLTAAWVELMPLKQDDLPEALRERFEVIEAEMLAAPDDLSALGDEAAGASAERILRLAMRLWEASAKPD